MLNLGEVATVPDRLGPDHQRVEGRPVQQGGRPVPRGRLLFLEICSDLGQTNRWHSRS